jgi:hypothetical protein
MKKDVFVLGIHDGHNSGAALLKTALYWPLSTKNASIT